MVTYKDAAEYLDCSINYEKTGFNAKDSRRVDLEKLKRALEKLDNPHHAYLAVHVAGTKGKGSVSTFISSILERAGFRVGLFTSPHLVGPLERVKINNKNISEDDFVRAMDLLKETLGGDLNKNFTYFEIFTLLTMLLFRGKKTDFGIFEVGLGGRLDATNVIDAKVSCITPISFDHTEVLGDTLKKIAREKSAIIKKGAHCACSQQTSAALDIIKEKCAQEGASLSLVGRDVTYSINKLDDKGSVFDIYGKKKEYKNCKTNLLGDFQVSNAALAVSACEHLLEEKDINCDAVKQGIEDAFIPGRLEVISRKPLIVIDGAQNGESAEKLKLAIKKIFKYNKLILILGLSNDKDVKEVCRHLTALADETILTRAQVERAMDPHIIRGYVKNNETKITKDTKEALGLALSSAGQNDLILAAGSFFVIGEIRKWVKTR